LARKPGSGICVHCCAHVEERNWDHVIPRSWYPESTPADLEKWKVPSCLECNSAYGLIERDLLLKLGLCLDSKEVASAGISERALRSIDPKFAKDERDRRARASLRAKALSETIQVDPASAGSLPGFGGHGAGAKRMAVVVPKNDLVKFGEKVVRGTVFLDTGRVVGSQYDLQIYFPNEGDMKGLADSFSQGSAKRSRGPGVLIESGVLAEDRVQGLYRVTIWGKFVLWGSVRSV